MKFSEFFTSKDNIQLDKKTLVILRWIALVGQYFTISIVYFIFKFELPFFYCSFIISIGILTNLYLQFKFNKNQLNNFTSTFFLFYDLIQLSLLLYLTGGITNPFSILLIVPAVVSSTFLTLRSTINLSIFTIIILVTLTFYNIKHKLVFTNDRNSNSDGSCGCDSSRSVPCCSVPCHSINSTSLNLQCFVISKRKT